MKKYLYYMVLFLFTSILFVSCSSSSKNEGDVIDPVNTKGQVKLTVHVMDNTTSADVGDAIVTIKGAAQDYNVKTNGDGRFTISFENDASRDLVVITSKGGYYTDTSRVTVSLDDEKTLEVKLQKMTAGSTVTGPASAIVLVSQSSQSIGVRETGSVETANILFEVQDSSGNAIDITNSIFVNFRFGVHPNGGEYLGPVSEKTNAQGRVFVNLSSGTTAGVVEIIAEIEPDGNKIKKQIISKPVSISIHGGHPDQTHFTLAAKQYNVAGWDWMGVQDPVTALVGDRYDNPAKPLTSVYFNTDGGVIEGSALTDNKGFGTVNLISGNPLPRTYPANSIFTQYPYNNRPGYFYVRAFTANENETIVSDTIVVLFSSIPTINIEPMLPDYGGAIPHGKSQVYKLTVQDVHGNPLASGTTITFSVIGEGVGGSKSIELGDYLFPGPGITEFYFSVLDKDNSIETTQGLRGWEVDIIIDGPNGKLTTSFTGSIE